MLKGLKKMKGTSQSFISLSVIRLTSNVKLMTLSWQFKNNMTDAFAQVELQALLFGFYLKIMNEMQLALIHH